MEALPLCFGFLEESKWQKISEKTNTVLRIAFFIIDYVDIVLDSFFAQSLIEQPGVHRGWAILLIFSVVEAAYFRFYSHIAGKNALTYKDGRGMNLMMLCAGELPVFLIEDLVTIFIFSMVKGSYDPNSLTDRLNVFTTTISSAIVVIGCLPLAIRMLKTTYGKAWVMPTMVLGPSIAVGFFSYLLIAKVYAQESLGSTLRVVTIVLFVIFYLVGYFWVFIYFLVLPRMDDRVNQQRLKELLITGIDDALRTVGKQSSFDPDQRVWALTYDFVDDSKQWTIVIEVPPSNTTSYAYFYVSLFKFGDYETQSSHQSLFNLFRVALMLNRAFGINRGGSLSLDPKTEMLTFQYGFRMSHKSAYDFQNIFENFIEAAIRVNDVLKKGTVPPDYPMTRHLMDEDPRDFPDLSSMDKEEQEKALESYKKYDDNIQFLLKGFHSANSPIARTILAFFLPRLRWKGEIDAAYCYHVTYKKTPITMQFFKHNPQITVQTKLQGMLRKDPVAGMKLALEANFLMTGEAGMYCAISEQRGERKTFSLHYMLTFRIDEISGYDLSNVCENLQEAAAKNIPKKFSDAGLLEDGYQQPKTEVARVEEGKPTQETNSDSEDEFSA